MTNPKGVRDLLLSSAAVTCHRSAMRRVLGTLLAVLALLVALLATPRSSAVPLHAAAAWAPAGPLPALGTGRVWSVAVNPADPRTVLAGTDSGIYRSADGGVTWTQSGLPGMRVWTVGYDLRKPNPAYAGLDGGGVGRSDDGATWTATVAGLPSPIVRSLAFGLSGIVAGTAGGVVVSADGQAWRAAGLAGYDVSALTVVTNTPTLTVIAGTDNAPSGQTGYLFINAGLNADWKEVDLPGQDATKKPVTVSSIAAGPIAGDTQTRPLLAATNQGLFRNAGSADQGSNWSQTYPAQGADAATSSLRLTTAAFSPIDPKLAYVGSDAGGSAGGQLLRSTDGGLTFQAFDQGLPPDNHDAAAIAVAGVSPPLLLVALDQPGKGGVVYAQTDATAPAPAPTGTPEAAGLLPSPTSAPTFSAPPSAQATPTPAASGSGGLRRVVDWPLPLAAELLVIVVAVYVFLRWRQRRLDIEGPP